ncbi:MAG TPA: hypothetical protein VHE35_37650, partial [Kofleriaceae bacterium]|nr:hypothetical protein [Kofleriaceae bacterium]
LLAAIGRARGDDAAWLWEARAATAPAHGVDHGGVAASQARAILARGDALAIGDVAVTGAGLMRELGLPPGREIGRLQQLLLEAVLDDPSRNTPDALYALARAARTTP